MQDEHKIGKQKSGQVREKEEFIKKAAVMRLFL